jgi:hypothetical protein
MIWAQVAIDIVIARSIFAYGRIGMEQVVHYCYPRRVVSILNPIEINIVFKKRSETIKGVVTESIITIG